MEQSDSVKKKPCRKCGQDKPLTEYYKAKESVDGHRHSCKSCEVSRSTAYRNANLEARKAYRRAEYQKNGDVQLVNANKWNNEHREHVRVRARGHYHNNRDRLIKQGAEYRSANRELVRASVRVSYKKHHAKRIRHAAEYRDANRDACRARDRDWKRRNPLKALQYNSGRRARIRSLASEPVDFSHILLRDGYICYLCNAAVQPNDVHFDHVIPLSRGGSHSTDNIKVTHSKCNLRKNNKTPEEYKSWLDALLHAGIPSKGQHLDIPKEQEAEWCHKSPFNTGLARYNRA